MEANNGVIAGRTDLVTTTTIPTLTISGNADIRADRLLTVTAFSDSLNPVENGTSAKITVSCGNYGEDVTKYAAEGYAAGMQEVDGRWIVAPASVTLEQSAVLYTNYGAKTAELVSGITPTGAAVTWASSNDAVATVDAHGVVTAVGNGTETITATVGSVSASCTVTVDTVGITLDQTAVTRYTNYGEPTVTLTPTVTPGVAAPTWATSDTSVATVDANGVVTVVGNGTATITATVGDASATCSVTVDTVGIALNQSTTALYTNRNPRTATLSATVTPGVATPTWSTSNANVATVDANGVVTAVGRGTATIIATVGENITASCEVTVSTYYYDDDDDDDDTPSTVIVPDEPTPLAPAGPAIPPVTPTAPAAPTTPVTPPTVEVEDPQVPLENAPAPVPEAPESVEVDEPQVPLASPGGWSLANLLLMLASILGGAYQLLKKDSGRYRLLALVPAMGSLLMFLLNENLSSPMVLFNGLTVFMVMIAAVQAALLVLNAKDSSQDTSAA